MTASDLVIETYGLTKRCGDHVAVGGRLSQQSADLRDMVLVLLRLTTSMRTTDVNPVKGAN